MLGLTGFLTLFLVLTVTWALGRHGARLLNALGRITPSPRDDRFFQALGYLWWGLVLLAGGSFLVHALALPYEPFRGWGERLALWLGSRGVGVLAALGLTLLGYRLTPLLLRRLPEPQGGLEREAVRLRTIKNLLESVLRVAAVVVGGLFVLSNLGFNITALLAGAGVAGLAVSFAAQNLIRDFINGFFILLEDQYGVGDIVQLNGLGGKVERFTLRLTVLRDLEGRVHFIPNSEVRQVTVLTQEWSRSVVDVDIAYKEDVDRALRVFQEEAQALYEDEAWRDRFTEPPEVLGIQALGASGVTIRTLFSTKPGEQWAVGREFRRRIKNRLDREGIEIPFPHQKVYFGEPLRLEGYKEA